MSNRRRDEPNGLKAELSRLTPREREVLMFIAQGRSIPQIATELNRSRKTVETHRLALGRKLHAKNSVELARKAIQGGLVTLPGERRFDERAVLKDLRDEAGRTSGVASILRGLDAATGTTTGEPFLHSLVEHLGPALSAHVAYVAVHDQASPTTQRTIAVWAHDRVVENFQFSTMNTICEKLVERSVVHYAAGMAKSFNIPAPLRVFQPDHAMGIALTGSRGDRLGVLVVMSADPFDSMREPELILRIVASRAGAELERLRAEEALRDSERRYRLLAEHSTDMISRHTPEGIYIYASPACRSLLGYDPEELVGRSAYEFFHLDDLAAIRASHETILERPVAYTVEYRLRRADQTYTWMETTSTAIRDQATGVIQELIAVTRDISARKAVQDELQEARDRLEARVAMRTAELERALELASHNEERYRSLIETVHAGFVVIDEQGRVLEASEEYVRLTGYRTLEEIRGRSVTEWTAPHDLERNTQEVLKCVTTGRVRHLKIDYRRPDGTIQPVDINATVVHGPEGLRVLSLCRDISDQRKGAAG